MKTRIANKEELPVINEIITQIFHFEQNIPIEIIPVEESLSPIWWIIELDSNIIGCICLYTEECKYHLGRFAILPEYRDNHYGRQLIEYALEDIFRNDIREITIEARDTAVHILQTLGAEITGEPFPFYDGNCTPVIIKKSNFIKNNN